MRSVSSHIGFMEELLKSISRYNIVNHLIPGVIAVALMRATGSFDLVQKELLIGIFLYYFVGLSISRVGSIIIEPMLKSLKLSHYVPYTDFISASKADPRIDELSETNNAYRSYLAAIVIVTLAIPTAWARDNFAIPATALAVTSLLGLIVLFTMSHRKQTAYISKRVELSKK